MKTLVHFKKLYFLVPLLCASTAFSQANRRKTLAPEIVQKNGEAVVRLGDDAKKALKAKDPTFRILKPSQFQQHILTYFDSKELPMAVSGDFNGDGKKDMVVMGISSSSDKVRVYALISQKIGGYSAEMIEEWKKDPRDTNKWRPLGKSEYSLRLWALYLSLADSFEKQTHNLSRKKDALKIESDSTVVGVYGYGPGGFKKANPVEPEKVEAIIKERGTTY